MSQERRVAVWGKALYCESYVLLSSRSFSDCSISLRAGSRPDPGLW